MSTLLSILPIVPGLKDLLQYLLGQVGIPRSTEPTPPPPVNLPPSRPTPRSGDIVYIDLPLTNFPLFGPQPPFGPPPIRVKMPPVWQPPKQPIAVQPREPVIITLPPPPPPKQELPKPAPPKQEPVIWDYPREGIQRD